MRHLRFMHDCSEANLEVQSLVPDAAVAARRELGFEVDSEEYRAIFADVTEAMRDAFARYAGELHELDTRMRAEFEKAQAANAAARPAPPAGAPAAPPL
jgi:hypothetical protein